MRLRNIYVAAKYRTYEYHTKTTDTSGIKVFGCELKSQNISPCTAFASDSC